MPNWLISVGETFILCMTRNTSLDWILPFQGMMEINWLNTNQKNSGLVMDMANHSSTINDSR